MRASASKDYVEELQGHESCVIIHPCISPGDLINFSRPLKGRDSLVTALSCSTGQICVLFFGLLTFGFSGIHTHQLLLDTRFVNAKDSAGPHSARTLRWVRVMDVLVCLVWSFFLIWLVLRLRSQKVTGLVGRKQLLDSFRCAVCVYTMGTLIDFAQCHFQAGGIGTHCNGYNCAQTALILSSSVFIAEYKPQVFWAICFMVSCLSQTSM
jgi:hypothetical protein